MKKIRMTAFLLTLCLLLSIPAMAAGPVSNDKATITVVEGSGATASFNTSNADIIDVTVTSDLLTAGEQYVVLMVKSDDGVNYTIDENSILYIDQTAAVAAGGKGSISFGVYPSSLQDSVILITGAKDGLLKAAIVEGKYILGDVDRNGVVNIGDVTALIRYIVGLSDEADVDLAASDVDSNKTVNIGDVTKLIRVIVGLEDL